jgi:hypothetical protein
MTDHMKLDRHMRSLAGIASHERAFGGMEYRLGRREIVHYHDDLAFVDIPFPRKVREDAQRAPGRRRSGRAAPCLPGVGMGQ